LYRHRTTTTIIQHFREDVDETTSERSIVASDSTENIQALRADLQAASNGHVTPAANHDDSSFTSSGSDGQKPRRNSKKKSSSKKKKQKNKRLRYSKRSQQTKIRSPDQGDEFSSSSDDSSSSSSSDDDSNSTSDKSQESILAFGKRGSMKNTNDITNDRKRFNTSKRIGRQVKKLAAAAKMYELKEFVISRGTIEQRKTHFLFWANTLRELLTPMYRYQALMRDFPRLNNRELTVTGNSALGLFLRLKLRQATLQTIEAAIKRENNDNGYLILQYMFSHYGNTTDVDISNAKQKLETTLWNDRDTIDTYTQRFMKRLSVVQESIAARPDKQHISLTEDYVTLLYLRLLITSIPKTHDQRAVIQTLYAKCQSEMTTFNTLDINVSTIQHDLFQLELTEVAHIDATDNHTYHRSHRPYQKHKPSHIRQSYRPSKQHAYVAQQYKKFKNVR
jgi:hypothetical protein